MWNFKFSILNQKDFKGDHAMEWNVILIFVIISDLFSALQASMLSGLMFHNLVSSALPILIIFPPCAWRSSPTHRLFALSMKWTLCQKDSNDKHGKLYMLNSLNIVPKMRVSDQLFCFVTNRMDQESLTLKMSFGSLNAEIVPRPRSFSQQFLIQM